MISSRVMTRHATPPMRIAQTGSRRQKSGGRRQKSGGRRQDAAAGSCKAEGAPPGAYVADILRWMRVRVALSLVVLCFSVVAAQNTTVAPRPDDRGVNTTVDPRDYQDLRWRNVGPTRGGRVTAIAGVRSQPCTFYMGGTGGGVFKTETCGERWTPISDGQIADGSIGSIDVSESNPNVVYVGTGSAAIRSNVIIGRGVYRSSDAGRRWTFLGLKDSGQIGAVKVHPTNPDIAWLAALGSPFGPNDERGIFKTTDGGSTWRDVLFVNRETGGRALAINMSNPDEI